MYRMEDEMGKNRTAFSGKMSLNALTLSSPVMPYGIMLFICS